MVHSMSGQYQKNLEKHLSEKIQNNISNICTLFSVPGEFFFFHSVFVSSIENI